MGGAIGEPMINLQLQLTGCGFGVLGLGSTILPLQPQRTLTQTSGHACYGLRHPQIGAMLGSYGDNGNKHGNYYNGLHRVYRT